MNYWLVKSEPESYSWADLVKDGRTVWTGIRNFQARNNLRAMKKNDPVFFYHSVSKKQIVGVASVARAQCAIHFNSSPVAACPGCKNVLMNSPSPQTVMPGNFLNHFPIGTSGSARIQFANSPS
jgi:hypothetical protein